MNKGIRLEFIIGLWGLGLALPGFGQIQVEIVKDIKVNQDEWGISSLENPLATLNPGGWTAMNSILYFAALDDLHGAELWRSDGTPQGTYMVKEITYGITPISHQNIMELTNVNGTLFFSALDIYNSKGHGQELWKSDGSETGTLLVKDICPGYESSEPSELTNADGKLFFVAADGYDPTNPNHHGPELWLSDGTETGTRMIKDITPGYRHTIIEELTAIGNQIFFTAVLTTPNEHDGERELWISDGTETGTHMVKDIWPGLNPLGKAISSNPHNLTPVNGKLFFAAEDPTHGDELWVSDGTETGTQLVKDIDEGISSLGENWSSSPRDLVNVNGTLFFVAATHYVNNKLYKSDGTPEGTILVKDFVFPDGYYTDYSPKDLIRVGNQLFFTVWDTYSNNQSHGRELWVSDGSPDGTHLVKDIYNGHGDTDPYPQYLTDVNGICYFIANDGIHGYELWRSDGTLDGTYMLKDIYPGNDPVNDPVPFNIINVGGRLFFSANDGIHGRELWTEKRDSSQVNNWTVF